MNTQSNFTQLVSHERARLTVQELTEHVLRRMRGFPGLTTNAVANLVFGWIRQEQPQILERLAANEIHSIVQGEIE